MTFGEKLQALRKQKGLSQEALAERLNVSRQAVSKWETGLALPDTEKVVQLSRLFAVTTDSLLLDERELSSSQAAPREESGEAKAAPAREWDPVKERRRRFRIVLGVFSCLFGIALGITALVMAERWAQETTWWHTDLGRFGTALAENWMGAVLALGSLLLLGGAVLLAREYIRKD